MTYSHTLRFLGVTCLAVSILGGSGCEAIVHFDRSRLVDSGADGATDMMVVDTGPRDLGPDTGRVDLGVDTGTDAGSDAGTDAGTDAGMDAGDMGMADMGMADMGECSTAAMCDDSDICTTDTCNASAALCVHTAISGCCTADAMCDDSMLCTTDACELSTHTCTHPAVSGCCTSAAMCDDTNTCTTDTCDTGTNLCVHTAVSSCCTSAAMCNDSNVCTTDACTVATGVCTNTMIASCCLGAGDCNDSDTCTTDACNGATHLCTHSTVASCCNTDAMCNDSMVCTADSCNTSAHTCTNSAIAGCCTTMAECNDSNVCTDDACNGSNVCTHTNNSASCAGGGTCGGGICLPPPTCAAYCTAVQANCTAGNAQYSSMANCMDACTRWGWAVGTLADANGNTVGCRQAAATAGSPNCAAAGPTGGAVCGASLCDDFCAAELTICTAGSAQYADMATCLSNCGAYTVGVVTDTSGDTLGCRTYHLEAGSTGVAGDVSTHCPHTSMSGGGVCI